LTPKRLPNQQELLSGRWAQISRKPVREFLGCSHQGIGTAVRDRFSKKLATGGAFVSRKKSIFFLVDTNLSDKKSLS
jgi:hypothetical protein